VRVIDVLVGRQVGLRREKRKRVCGCVLTCDSASHDDDSLVFGLRFYDCIA